MSRTVVTNSEVRQDHTLTLILPEDVPPGRVRVTVTLEAEEAPRKLTARELATSEFASDWKDSPFEEASELRRRAWERARD